MFVLQPTAEIGNGDDLPSDRVVSIALFGNSSRVGVEVFAQRTLAKPFNGAWESEELVYHPSRVTSGCPKLCRAGVAEKPMIGRWNFNMRHSPGRGIVPQRMRRNGFGNAATSLRLLAHQFHRLPLLYVPARDVAREKPLWGLLHAPPVAQDFQEPGRQHDVAILLALTLIDANHHSRAVNIWRVRPTASEMRRPAA